MKNILIKILCLVVTITFCMPQESDAAFIWPFKKKKKAEKVEKLTPYQKLFKGKKVQTARGMMTIHKVNDKVYVEFPLAMLGREMMFTSSIENTSDNGEGAPGQFGGASVRFNFDMIDSTLVARMPLLSKPVNTSGDTNIARALNNSHNPGIFKSFKVLAYSPDSTAVVVDMKTLFLESSSFTKPFPSNSANGYYGFVTREHSLKADKSSILGVEATKNNLMVREELCYSVDHALMGAYDMYKDVPLTAVVNKILCLLPEEPMKPRISDSRLGMNSQLKSDFAGTGKNVKTVRYAKRWRIEPSDEQAYRRGESVTPKKPLVFYIDSMMPRNWLPYIKAGAESWNKAFEQIGLKDVVRVEEFPKNDTIFDAFNIDYMTIRYSASWMNSAQNTMHVDSRTGEILNTSILINANMISVNYGDRVGSTAASDPRVRRAVLPVEVQGEMIQAEIAKAVGSCLGLTMNEGGAYAYPVDSLRSVDFTRKHGLASSIMSSGLVINDVATADDVRRGVRMVNTQPGAYDYLVIKYLYQPIEAASLQAETDTLDGWIRSHSGDPRYAYVRRQPSFASDPRNADAIGNDHLKSLAYVLPNIREAYNNYYVWFNDNDRDLSLRRRVRSALSEKLSYRVDAALSYIGGIYLNDIREKDVQPSYIMVDRDRQREALTTVIDLARDLSWLDDKARNKDFEIADPVAERFRLNIFNSIFSRLSYVEVCTERFPDKAYLAHDYLDDIYNAVWEPALKQRQLNDFDRALQTAFLESIITTSSVTAPVGSFARPKTSFAATSENRPMPAINLAELRDGMTMNREKIELQNAGEVSGFRNIPSIRSNQTKISAYYFDLLLRTRDMLKQVKKSASAADYSHYDLLLYRIEKAMDFQ